MFNTCACLPTSTHIYSCLPNVYTCLPVYPCLLVFTYVYLCLSQLTRVYICLPLFTRVCLPMITQVVYLCLNIDIRVKGLETASRERI